MIKSYKFILFIFILIATSIIIIFFRNSKLHNLLNTCQKESLAYKRLICLKPYFEELTTKYSAKIAISEAQKLKDQKVIDDCHLAAHFIGEENFKKSKNVGEAFATCSLGCIEGCFHGVMEGYLKQSNLEQFEENITNICQMPNLLLKRQCIHGAGHGIFRHQEIGLLKAINLCKKLENNWSDLCLGGVFMENMDSYLLESEENLKKNLAAICDSILQDQQLARMCANAIGEGLMFYTGHNLEKSINLCQYLQDDYQQECINAATQEKSTNNSN